MIDRGYALPLIAQARQLGISRGSIYYLPRPVSDTVRLAIRDGVERLFEPGRLLHNLKHDVVSIHAVEAIDLHEGDRIRWTENDPARDLLNSGLVRVKGIREGVVTVSSLADSSVYQLSQGNRMVERLDLAYALNAHIAQRVTTEHGIVMMSAGEPKLASGRTLLVTMTRIIDKAMLIVDSGRSRTRGRAQPGQQDLSARRG